MMLEEARLQPPSQKKIELIGLIFLAVSLFTFASLLSYNPQDPSLNSASSTHQVENFGGIVGSYLADIVFQFFGFGGFLLPLFMLLGSARVLLQKRTDSKTGKIFGCLIILLSLLSLLHIQFNQIEWKSEPMLAGGVAGQILGKFLVRYLNRPGSYILLISSFIIGLDLASTSFSLIRTFQSLSSFGKWLPIPGKKKLQKQPPVSAISPSAVKTSISPPPTREIPSKHSDNLKVAIQEPKEPNKGNTPLKTLPLKKGKFKLPDLEFLEDNPDGRISFDKEMLLQNCRLLEQKLRDFGVEGKVVEVHPGPVITVYEFEPASGVKVNKIVSLADDLSLALSALSVRIVAPIPGKSVVGVEIPNDKRQVVHLKELLTSREYHSSAYKLPLAIGKDISGAPLIADLAKMPHLLVAGATGAGKSVFINAIICSLLYRYTPDQLRFLMIDPKMLELSLYDGIPHLLLPVVTDPKKAAQALRWAVKEMERRYLLMTKLGVRHLEAFNKKIDEIDDAQLDELFPEPDEPPQPLPMIIVIIDELADLMMVASKEVELSIARLAQMARASGIHLLVATQRPSVDILTGLIKANFPARISFQVSSKVDSRTILDTIGAERLLGAGDMLFLPPGTAKLTRIHGGYVSDVEIKKIVHFLKQQGSPLYDESILQVVDVDDDFDDDEDDDEKYREAVELVAKYRYASISMLQRRLRIGYNRAARMIEQMEAEKIIGPSDGSRPREVFINTIDN